MGSLPPPPPNTINTANEGRFRLNCGFPIWGKRAIYGTHARPSARLRRPARPRWDFIFKMSMRESKASSVVVCLHHAGERRHFRLVVSSSVGHCCQHFWVGWGPNRIKGGLRRGKCQPGTLSRRCKYFLVGFSWTTLMLLCTRVPKLHVPAAKLWKELVLDVHEASHLSPR